MIILTRKFFSAAVSGTLYAIMLSLAVPNLLGPPINSIGDYFSSVISIIPFHMMFSFPVILVYGVATSWVSDKISEAIMKKYKKEKYESLLSFIFHLLFGLILLWLSLGAAILFFIIDQILKKKDYKISHAIVSFFLPFAVFLASLLFVWIDNYL